MDINIKLEQIKAKRQEFIDYLSVEWKSILGEATKQYLLKDTQAESLVLNCDPQAYNDEDYYFRADWYVNFKKTANPDDEYEPREPNLIWDKLNKKWNTREDFPQDEWDFLDSLCKNTEFMQFVFGESETLFSLDEQNNEVVEVVGK